MGKDKKKDHVVFVSRIDNANVPEIRVALIVGSSKKLFNVKQSEVVQFYGSVVRKEVAHVVVTEKKAMLMYQEYLRAKSNFHAARLSYNATIKGLVE